DEALDVTTPELEYPLAHPTTARREILRTLVGYGKLAYRAMPLLEAIASCRECGTWATDPEIVSRAAEAATQIRDATPECCRKPPPAAAPPLGLQLVDKRERKTIESASLPLLDQEGNALRLSDMQGRPFVLAFFYTRCTNPVKCVSTIRRLRDLAADCAKDAGTRKAAVFGMTYDPKFDTPQILRNYGTVQGMKFGPNVRLVKAAIDSGDALRRELDLRVSYGAGTVSQHGVQLFVFDKQGKLAATHDNEVWSVADVHSCLARLAAE
ncbi:MAG TPA: SCO family protein, partial [Thermoanaerobaculia bacterium]